MMDEDKLILNRAADKFSVCEKNGVITNTSFLDLNARSVLQSWIRRENIKNCLFYGGYDDAERTALCFFPGYILDFEENPDDCPVTAVRAKIKNAGAPALTHRDYLGALMGIGLKRELTGDILAYGSGADIILMRESLPIVIHDFAKAGRAELECTRIALSELASPEVAAREIRDTVASPRLDAVVGVAFSLPRSKAAEAVERGLVFVNNRLCEKGDSPVSEGDKITLRGQGRAVVTKLGPTSRSGRIFITVMY